MATAVQVEALWSGLTDNNGQPLAAGKVFTYAAGTTTPVSLFTAADKSTSATNPLILDAYGKAQVWADGRYKFVVKTSADVTLYTLDNLLYGFDDTTVLYGGTSTGSANAHTVSVPATVTSYANGQTISFIAGYTNTGATTLQFNSLAAINLVKGATPSSLQSGDLIAGQLYTATYHGGTFRLQDYPSVADIQRSRYELASVSGTNTITATLTPEPGAYEAGMLIQFVAVASNTGPATLNLNGLGARAVQKFGAALTGGEIVSGQTVQAFYDGTNFQLLSSNVGNGTATAPSISFGADTNTGMYLVSADNLGFATNGVRKLYITNTGAHVIESVVPSGYALQVFNNDTGGNAYGLIVDGARNDFALAVRDNTSVYRHQFNANGSLAIGAVGANTAAIQVDTSGRPSFVTGSTVRLQVDTSGNVLINKTAINQTDPGTYFNKGSATDQASMYAVKTTSGTVSTLLNWHNGTYVGGVDMSNTATSFPTSSDYRLKENVVPMTGALAKLNQLKPCTFNFITEPTETITGFLAHEVAAVVPNAVGGEKDAVNADGSIKTQTLDHSKLVPLLTGALKELAAKVVELQDKITAIEASVEV